MRHHESHLDGGDGVDRRTLRPPRSERPTWVKRATTQDKIDSFWSGESFDLPESQELSYHLAVVLVRNLMSDYPRRVLDFLNSAEFSDAGNAALIDSCGISLVDLVGQFLGRGPWSPRTDYSDAEA
ncbi:MAG: hypothetical protein DWQ31_15260 [Planctomycetota bacterium]|nr:MAG: hypothetical protein DWQ31_15260 [Planctomycetota bacterium]REJ87415.1 MAG: hypothetical protein DWQ35_21375 [Planctomycetota bacterium]REK30793.1 MAG: hypothetical protein DWQ42_01545 [Planctomycetota bacterium]REK42173.1 MAG: hypothetical protein DWQ46_14425 [Planctomycetota bacterium]